MTTTPTYGLDRLAHSKTCPVCKQQFFRRRLDCDQKWARRVYCSRECLQSKNGARRRWGSMSL